MRFTLTILLFFSCSLLFPQNTIKGRIIDSESRTAISYASLTETTSEASYTTDNNGVFNVPNGTYLITGAGYLSKTILLEDDTNLIIELDINPQQLNQVIVNVTSVPQQLKKSVTSINIVTQQDIQRGNDFNIAPILNRVPGVYQHSGALNTNRITIRGIGSRNLFGTSNIRAYFKDIPLTSGNGDTTIEDFELASISRMEITKGAVSSIYGAGLGGTIQLTPKNSLLNETSANSELTIGSFGLLKGTVNINHGGTKNSFRAVYSNTKSDGYRDNNNYNRQTFTVNSNHYLGENDELSFLGSYVSLKAFIPSSLNENTFNNNPTAAAFTWAQSQGFEDTKRGIFGVTWNHQYSDQLKQVTSIFTSFRNSYEPRPFNILQEELFAVGLRTRLLGSFDLFQNPLNWTFGGELFNDRLRSETFENLYEDFPPGTGSVEGLRLSNFKENRYYFNLFAEGNYDITQRTRLSVGLNVNQTGYDLEDRFTVSADNPDQSGDFKFDLIASPKFGISHELSNTISVYGSVSHGFSPITLQETLLPDGQINTDLEPETGWNYEIGSRGQLLSDRLQYSIALFRLDIRNLLVSRRTAEDQFIGINAGETQNDGLELQLNYQWLKQKAISLSSFLSYTLNNFKFETFIDGDNDFSGNDLTGVPSEVLNAGVDFNTEIGLYGNINFQYVGQIPITDSNSLYSDDYSLTNMKLGYQFNITNTIEVNTYFGIDNIFDETYASQILINARGFGGNAPRYFYPGNPVNYYGGVNINYVF